MKKVEYQLQYNFHQGGWGYCQNNISTQAKKKLVKKYPKEYRIIIRKISEKVWKPKKKGVKK